MVRMNRVFALTLTLSQRERGLYIPLSARQGEGTLLALWIPACAGMTNVPSPGGEGACGQVMRVALRGGALFAAVDEGSAHHLAARRRTA